MLVKIQTNKQGEQLVSARELYMKLEVKRDFTTWIKARIEKYGFKENIDFTTVWNNPKTGVVKKFNGSIRSMAKLGYRINYILKLDMAKEISMIENNDHGRQIRQYFIRCEKDLTLALEERLERLEIENKMNKDKFSKKEMNHMFEAMFNIIKLADELHTDIAKVDDLLGSIHKREEYIAMFSDNVKYFAKDKFDGEIYKGNKICKIKPRSDKND